MKAVISILCAALFLAPVLAQTADGDPVEVRELKLATSVSEERVPVDPSDSFANGTAVFTWLKLHVREDETTIKLRYSIDGIVTWTSDPITIRRSVAWRTWLRKAFFRSGEWTVEVLDSADTPIHSQKFTVN